MIRFIQGAGVLHFLVAGANFFAARLFRYRDNMNRVEPFVREVFWVQNGFIVLTTLALGALCLRLPRELLNGSAISRSISGFGCLFWALRLIVQLGFYDVATKRRFPIAHWMFTLLFVFLTLVFGIAALRS